MAQPPPSSPLAPQSAGWNQAGVQPRPQKKPSKAPKILIILGAIVLVLSVVIGVVVAVIGLGGAFSTADELEVFDSGSGTVTAEAGESLQIYAPVGMGTPVCTVDGPSVGAGTIQTSTITADGTDWASIDSFTAETAGDYAVECDSGPVAVGPPVSIGSIFAGLGGIFVAIGGGAVGIVLLLIGVVLVLVRRNRA